MSSLPVILLRVLLSVVLIFNGSGYAYAATQLHMAGAPVASDAVNHDMAAHDVPPCHDAEGDMAYQDPAPPKDGIAGHDSHDDSNCCQTDQCDCVCAQHVPATNLAFWLRSPTLARSHVPAYRPAQHLSPALSHLQRPPIG
ncbi:CopL family metal-binding regulatory protein [Pseudoxanthomonas sp. UTMC 1351]|uniref:CopL family metal-binding regulatory protein n=1 Tax=Pseudoxanthomonas sp. UTMC 1351 TaxID=2695853 RepID=UPI0034CD6B6A